MNFDELDQSLRNRNLFVLQMFVVKLVNIPNKCNSVRELIICMVVFLELVIYVLHWLCLSFARVCNHIYFFVHLPFYITESVDSEMLMEM